MVSHILHMVFHSPESLSKSALAGISPRVVEIPPSKIAPRDIHKIR
jgi:hypothetical protein